MTRRALGTGGLTVLWLMLGQAAWAQTAAVPDSVANHPAAPTVKKPVRAGPARPTASPAAAARDASSKEDPAGASLHLSRAAELYQSGQFDEVVPELQTAYHLNPLPRILCNIAQAYRKGGHLKEAAEQYDLCLRTDPKLTPQERAEFTTYREQALAAVVAEAAANEPPSPAAPPAVAAPSPPPVTVPAASAAPRPVYKRAWFWGVLGGVVAAGAVTAGILAWQLGKPDPLALLPPNTPLLRF